jgi:DNA-binding NarL/FixJ family response regulator
VTGAEEGEGSRRPPEHGGSRAKRPGAVDPAGPHERAGSPKILIVEDDHLVALDIEAALLDAGFAVTGIAASAEEALRRAKDERPRLVLMDIRLAGGSDGVAAALDLYREEGIRSLFATAHSDSEMRRRAEDARPLGWLAKPYQPHVLIRAVREALAALERSP